MGKKSQHLLRRKNRLADIHKQARHHAKQQARSAREFSKLQAGSQSSVGSEDTNLRMDSFFWQAYAAYTHLLEESLELGTVSRAALSQSRSQQIIALAFLALLLNLPSVATTVQENDGARVYIQDNPQFASQKDALHDLFASIKAAADAENIKALQQLIRYSYDPADPQKLFSHDKKMMNLLLQHAVLKQRPRVVGLLVDEGADVNFVANDQQLTLLHTAAASFPGMVAVLIKKGADLEAKGLYGQTPLHTAVAFGHLDVVKQLLKAGANADTINKEGIKALDTAVLGNQLETAKELLRYGAQPDLLFEDGQTLLHEVIQRNCSLEMSKLLVNYKVLIDVKNNQGKTARDLAVEVERQDIVQFLDSVTQRQKALAITVVTLGALVGTGLYRLTRKRTLEKAETLRQLLATLTGGIIDTEKVSLHGAHYQLTLPIHKEFTLQPLLVGLANVEDY